jgi:hypothetical protein
MDALEKILDEPIICIGIHFPERIYNWKIGEIELYFAHCALCHSDYSIKELNKIEHGGIYGK